MTKKLIVGLGNPGPEYVFTRHNVGFRAVDFYKNVHNAPDFQMERYGWVTRFTLKGKQIILLKPNTFMNLSGAAVRYYLTQEKVEVENLMVITDDIALPYGKQRIRPKGSGGGHNGLGNIEQMLGNNEYPRLRFGVGSDFGQGRQVEYVLGRFEPGDEAELPLHFATTAKALDTFVLQGLAEMMNGFSK